MRQLDRWTGWPSLAENEAQEEGEVEHTGMVEKQVVDEVQPDGYASPVEERVIVRAARLRLSTDKKQGIESPSWVKEIAKRLI
ncbi:MAG: hypothetical protein JWM01_989 [Arthrobacter sp.]|nr:hypothetical protein [Arthrobacter sp.]